MTSFTPSYLLAHFFMLQPLLPQPTMLCHGLALSAWSISCFLYRASLPPAHGMPAEAHPAVLAQALTGECVGVDIYHWGNLLPLKCRDKELTLSSSLSDNSENSKAQFTQLSKDSQQDQAPSAHNGDQLDSVPLDWLSFLPFTIPLQTLLLPPWNNFPK